MEKEKEGFLLGKPEEENNAKAAEGPALDCGETQPALQRSLHGGKELTPAPRLS